MVPGQCLKGEQPSNLGLSFRETLPLSFFSLSRLGEYYQKGKMVCSQMVFRFIGSVVDPDPR